MPFLAATMGGWWIFVGALAGILTVPRGIHGWYFWSLSPNQLFGLLCRSGVIGDHRAHSHQSHRPPNWIRFSSILDTFPALSHKSIHAAGLWPKSSFTFFYLELFPLIQATVNVIYSSSCRGRPGTPSRTPGGGQDPALGPFEQLIVSQS